MPVLQGENVRKRLLTGALKLADIVSVTYGPYGRNCILDRLAGLLSTRDGATIARDVILSDQIENQGAAFLKDACIQVNNTVGDGTTTTVLLAAEIIKRGHRQIAAGMDRGQLCSGIRSAAKATEEVIVKLSSSVASQTDLARIAELASNGDIEVSALLAEAAMAAGKDGIVVVEDGVGTDTLLEFKEGLELDRGPLHLSFLRSKSERVLEGPLVAVVNTSLNSVADVQDLLETASQWRPRGLLLFAQDVCYDALTTLLLNDSQSVISCVPIACPGYGLQRQERLKDIAALSGATLISQETGQDFKKWDPEWFGAVRQVSIRKEQTILTAYDNGHPGLQDHIRELRHRAETAASDFDRDELRKRLAGLSGGLAYIKVGGLTELARKDRRSRIEDALAAVRAALRQGVVAGGGTAYFQASLMISPEKDLHPLARAGWDVAVYALAAPLYTLAKNSGRSGDVLVDHLIHRWAQGGTDWTGWDAVQDRIRDLRDEPSIMDPTAVVLAALRSAVSVATMLLMTDVFVSRVRHTSHLPLV